MNVELLQRVKQHILEEPNRLSMNSEIQYNKPNYYDALDGFAEEPKAINLFPPCNTAACIAGWTCILGQSEFTVEELQVRNLHDRARNLLGLTDTEIDRLYYTGRWPTHFYEAFKTTDIQKRAEVAAARIDHFIETGE